MSRRCKVGQRARIITRGRNYGAVVIVIRQYLGEAVNGAAWPEPVFPWVVTSLGAPLNSVELRTLRPCAPSMTIVLDDDDLQPLSDNGQGLEDAADCGLLLRQQDALVCPKLRATAAQG